MEDQEYPLGSVLTGYIANSIKKMRSEITRGYESGRTIAFNTRRLKEHESSIFHPRYSRALLREVERIGDDTKAVNLGFHLYRFLNHFDCKVIDRSVKAAEDYVKTNPEPEIKVRDKSGIERIIALAQDAADEVNRTSEIDGRHKIVIKSFPDWMY